MAILWAGGEDIDFNSTDLYTDTTIAYYRSGYARLTLAPKTNNALHPSWPFTGGAVTSCWFSCRMYTLGQNANERIFGLGKNGTTCGIFLVDSGSGRLRLVKDDGAGSVTTLATETGNSLLSSTLQKFDIAVTSINDTVNGNIKVYIGGNSSPIIDFTGNATLTGFTSIDIVQLAGKKGGAYDTWFSECIVSDSDSRTLSLVTHYANAVGDTDDWEGTYTDIDETEANDADLVYTATVDEDFQANMSNVPAGSFIVPAIIVKARATKSIEGSAVGTLKLGVKSGGSIDVDAGHALTTSWATYERIAATINGGAMTTALLDAMQLDLRSAA